MVSQGKAAAVDDARTLTLQVVAVVCGVAAETVL